MRFFVCTFCGNSAELTSERKVDCPIYCYCTLTVMTEMETEEQVKHVQEICHDVRKLKQLKEEKHKIEVAIADIERRLKQ